MRQRLIRKIVWRCVVTIIGLWILFSMWRFVSFTIRQIFPEKAQEEENLEDTEPITIDNEEKFADSVPVFTYSQNLLLVNKDHPLDEKYDPDLKKLSDYGVYVDESIYDALISMLKAGEQEGLRFWVASGYRSPERQRELLDEDIGDLVRQGYSYSEAYEEVVRETMPVGCSEHATGLSVDIVAKDYQILDKKQEQTKENEWLQENCSRYGFILRYPEDKEDITKVDYESWHFRYVGSEAAAEIMKDGITLEEYLENHPDTSGTAS